MCVYGGGGGGHCNVIPRHVGSHMPSSAELSQFPGGRRLSGKELIMAQDRPHITMQRIT